MLVHNVESGQAYSGFLDLLAAETPDIIVVPREWLGSAMREFQGVCRDLKLKFRVQGGNVICVKHSDKEVQYRFRGG